jgi:protein lysine acetyltransferase
VIAVARFVRLVTDPETAEAAIVVADPFQGKGAGSALGDRLAWEARIRGIRRFSATILSDNVPAQRLMAKLSVALESHQDGPVSELIAPLAA